MSFARPLSPPCNNAITVRYDGVSVGEYVVDLLVESEVLVEINRPALDEVHHAQCINYLNATGLRLCLLINFAKPRLVVKRIVLNL